MANRLTSLSLWIRAFIPSVVLKADNTEASATISSGPYIGKNVIPGPLGIGWFHTDDRTFAFEKSASSRAYCETLVDFVNNQVTIAERRCDVTLMFTSLIDGEPNSAVGDSSRLVARDITITNERNGGKVFKFTLRGEAGNPLAPGSPDIDWDIKIIVEVDAGHTMGRVIVEGLVDPFPAYEMYASTSALSMPINLFNVSPAPGKDPWNLVGNPTIPVQGNMPIKRNFGASLDGTWESNDANQRFQLKISGSNVDIVERKSTGEIFSYSTTFTRDGGSYKLERPNTEPDLLTFLDFKQAIHKEILNRHPIPSFHVFFREGDKLRSKWYGLLVTLKPDGSFNQMFNPGEKPPKDFEFTKTT